MLVTCYVLLAKKSGTIPQMIPNFKGGFRGRPRDRGAEGPRGRGAEGPRDRGAEGPRGRETEGPRGRGAERPRGRGGRGHPFFFEILYYCYRIVRKIKSISLADKWASVPATPFWIFWIRPWISTKNDPVKSLDSTWCWVLEQRIYRVDVFLKNLFVKQNLCSSVLLLAKSIYWRNWRTWYKLGLGVGGGVGPDGGTDGGPDFGQQHLLVDNEQAKFLEQSSRCAGQGSGL